VTTRRVPLTQPFGGWRWLLVAAWVFVVVPPAVGQSWDVETSKAPETTRLAYEATEGTWMSLDVSPDGRSIVFDLLGHIYEMPIAGGAARPLTSGRSWNMFPRYSPDGKTILFTSDRAGVEDQWLFDRASSRLTGYSNILQRSER
jgi:Tol biopolymer transport system component